MAQLLTPHALMYAAAGPIFLTMLVITLRLWRVSRHRMTALNNMSQGLCMFDAAGRIMVRNQPYLDDVQSHAGGRESPAARCEI